MSLIGGFYLLEKKGETWQVTHQKEVTEGKEITKENFETLFPKSNLDNSKPYWDFMEKKDDLDKICDKGSCEEEEFSAGPPTTYE